jgi:integrase
MPGFVTEGQAPDMDMIHAFTQWMERRYFSAVTVQDRTEIVTRLDAELTHGLAMASRDELETWLNRPQWSPATKATYFKALKSAYGFWADPDDPWIDFNPTIGMAQPPQPRGVPHPVEDEVFFQLLGRARPPYRLWVVLGGYQGLRCLEIAGLDREHITRDRLWVVRGKGGRPRIHDTDPMVWDEVRHLPSGPVARTKDGQRATAKQISCNAYMYFRRELGLEVSMHQLRHWLGVNVQRRYRDIRVTQAVLGHASLSSTQIYTEADAEQQAAARATLPRPGGWAAAAGRPAGEEPTPTSQTQGEAA